MRIIRVRHDGRAFYATFDADGQLNCLQANLGYSKPFPLEEAELLPLVAPSKIICVGLNFRDHARELSMPLSSEPSFFLKPPSSLAGDGQAILMPRQVGQIDYEAELAVIMGQRCRNVTPGQAGTCVFGCACANDVTARDLQKNERMIGRCKGYDTFCPLGPWIETELPRPEAGIRTYVNDVMRQEGFMRDMLVQPLELVSFLSRIMTLMPGDVILTGTPHGVGPLLAVDTVSVEVDGVGRLVNRVEWDDSPAGADVPRQRLQ